VQGDVHPDLTILLDAPLAIALARIKQRGKLDRFEAEEINFFERVRKEYLAIAKANPQRFRIISTNQNEAQVQERILHILDELI
jgi:dTMP kinase